MLSIILIISKLEKKGSWEFNYKVTQLFFAKE